MAEDGYVEGACCGGEGNGGESEEKEKEGKEMEEKGHFRMKKSGNGKGW